MRKNRNRTQAELAYKIGKDQQSIQRLESGIINPTLYYLNEIAQGLNIVITCFFSFEFYENVNRKENFKENKIGSHNIYKKKNYICKETDMKTNNHSLLISIDHLLEEKMRNINGENILLDFEVAELLLISTKDLIRKVRANKDRFPADFLTKISPKKFSITLPQSEKHRKILYAFTLSGIIMASGLFKTTRANQISIQMVEFMCERYGGMERILEWMERAG